jgi:hypothetical protein
LASYEFGAALANQNTARRDEFPAEPLHSEAFAYTVAPVADASLTFLMCHTLLKFNFRNADLCQFLSVPDGLVKTLTTLHLECHLFWAAKMLDNIRYHRGVCDRG